MAPIRVLFLTGSLATGGSEAHVATLLSRLDRAQIEPVLLLLRAAETSHWLPQVRRLGVPVHDLGISPGKLGFFKSLVRIRRSILALGPDVVHSYGYPCNVYAPLVAPISGRPYVITTRRGNEIASRRNRYYRVVNRLTDHVLCVSETSRAFAAEHEGLRPNRSSVIVNGVDTARFYPRSRGQSSPRVIGTHGRIDRIKGTDLLLEAFRKLQRPDVALRVAGPCPSRWAEELRASHEDSPGVSFEGDLSDVAGFLRSLDVYVLPSRSEGMSMALLEAMACGLPVVATDVDSNAGLLAGGGVGILASPDADSIAVGIQRLLDDPAYACRLGSSARRRVEHDYGVDAMIRRYEGLYRSIGERRPEGRR